MNTTLPLQTRRLLEAAEGWLQLKDSESAREELGQVDSRYREHPEVIKAWVEVHSMEEEWPLVVDLAEHLYRQSPDQPYAALRLAYALHELKRTQEAWNTLLPIADRHPEEWVIPYNLACYAAQLGDLPQARTWLAKALKVGDRATLDREARRDPDLAPLWAHGSEEQK